MKQQGLFAGAALLSLCVLGIFWFWKMNPSHGSKSEIRISSYQIGCISNSMLGKIPRNSRQWKTAVFSAAQRKGVSLVLSRKLVITCPIHLTLSAEKAFRNGKGKPASALLSPVSQSPFGVLDRKAVEQKLSQFHGRSLENLLDHIKRILRNAAIKNRVRIVFSKSDLFYGGKDITPTVLHLLQVFAQGRSLKKERVPVSSPPDLAYVDLKKIIPLDPDFFQFQELNREIASWKIGSYGMAEPLLSPRQKILWENDCRKTQLLWNRQMAEMAQKIPARLLNSVQSFFDLRYQEALRKDSNELQKDYKIETRKNRAALQSYAGKQAFHAQKQFILYQETLEVKNLGSKNPLPPKKLKKKLLSYHNVLSKQIQASLNKYAEKLNFKEKKRLKTELLKEQNSALKEAKQAALQRYGSAADSYFSLSQKQAAVENWLEKQSEVILAHSPVYQTDIQKIESGDHQIVTEVVKKMKSEREEVLRKIKSGIFRQAEILAGKQGVRTVISGAILNINELNLTPQLINLLKR